MGYTVKNTTFDFGEDDIRIGDSIWLLDSKEEGIVVMKIGNIYQIKKKDGKISNYTRGEIAKKSL